MNKAFVWVGAIFTPLGLLFAGAGGWAFMDDQKLADIGVDAEGTVIAFSSSRDSDGDTTYRPLVEFYDDNGTRHQFVASVGSSSPAYIRGEAVKVIYDPEAPGRAMLDSFTDRYLLPLVFGVMGSIFALVGAGFLFSVWRRRKIIDRLKRTGIPINGKFLECYRDTSTKVNGRSPYRVVAQTTHPASGKLQSFKSDPIWIDLSEQLEGQQVKILVDPEEPKHHFVDLSEFT
ncbi:DUF3592 domain-containing protein [Sphingomonadaceae bacterium]|nr:DUF3592 domain-containing protein [Sphingomonadaceae bacterium]